MRLMAATPPIRGVVVFLHGLSLARIDPYPLDFNLFTEALAFPLKSDGWTIIQPAYAEDNVLALSIPAIQADITADAAHGARYLAQMLHWWDHVVAWIRSNYGAVPITLFGLSWGGWHALQIAAQRPSSIIAYSAHVPVTVLSECTIAGFAINTTGLDVSDTALNAVTVPGAIGWSNPDTVVGFAHTSAIATAAAGAGQPLSVNPTHSDGHALSSTSSAFYAAWFASTVDPLAPAIF